jgi:hypothetical protein
MGFYRHCILCLEISRWGSNAQAEHDSTEVVEAYSGEEV